MCQRRRVTRPMPRSPNSEELAQRGNLPRRTQAADLRNVNAYEVNQALFDERHIFVLCIEQFALRKRNTRLLAQQTEVIIVFRRERVFEEKQTIRFERLAQIDRLI